MRFDDDEYLNIFYTTGKYPKIHDDIFSMHKVVECKNVIDLGCCTGLLSHRLSTVYNSVIGIEPSEKYLKKAVKSAKIKYKNMSINDETIDTLKDIILDNKIDGIYCRRVVPEIYETGGMELVKKFIEVLYNNGVEFVVLEGRKSNRNAINPLKSIVEENKVFNGYYETVASYRNCRVLRRRG